MTLTTTAVVLNALPRAASMSNNDNFWARRTQILPSMSWKKTSDIEIVLDGESQFIHSYSTYDEIAGHVNICFEKDTCIDDFAITFVGQTSTWIEKVATASPTMGRATGKHTFLRVRQPIDQNCLPEYNRAQAGVVYTIPFKFVVPERILDFICSHKTEQEDVKEQHLQLPPSMGDQMLSGNGNTLMDDLAPNMSKITYSIRVGLLKASPSVRKAETIEAERGIRIVPAREELPPLSLDLLSKQGCGKYCLRREKNVRKGIMKIGKKQGRLTVEATQPPSLKLHHPSQSTNEPLSTVTTVQLRYDPVSVNEQPPALNSVVNKLKAYTFFGAAPWPSFPAPDGYDIWSTMHSQYPATVDLSTRNISNVEWKKHEPGSSSATASRANSEGMPQRSKSVSNSIPSHHSAGTHGSRSSAGADNFTSRRASMFSYTSRASSSSSLSTTQEQEDNDSGSQSPDTSEASTASFPSPRADIISPSTTYNASLPYYTTSIIVPITLPTTANTTDTTPSISTTSSQSCRASTTSTKPTPSKSRSKPPIFLPTFHSCLISRIYTLDLSISAQNTPNLNLHVPLQISLPKSRLPSQPPSDDSAPPSWNLSDPFAYEFASDEAIARALAANYTDEDNGDDADQLENAATPTAATTAGRHMSLPILPGRPAEAPPEYNSFSTVRRVSAARRAATGETVDAGSSSSNSGVGVGGRREQTGRATFSSKRRSVGFNLLL